MIIAYPRNEERRLQVRALVASFGGTATICVNVDFPDQACTEAFIETYAKWVEEWNDEDARTGKRQTKRL